MKATVRGVAVQAALAAAATVAYLPVPILVWPWVTEKITAADETYFGLLGVVLLLALGVFSIVIVAVLSMVTLRLLNSLLNELDRAAALRQRMAHNAARKAENECRIEAARHSARQVAEASGRLSAFLGDTSKDIKAEVAAQSAALAKARGQK